MSRPPERRIASLPRPRPSRPPQPPHGEVKTAETGPAPRELLRRPQPARAVPAADGTRIHPPDPSRKAWTLSGDPEGDGRERPDAARRIRPGRSPELPSRSGQPPHGPAPLPREEADSNHLPREANGEARKDDPTKREETQGSCTDPEVERPEGDREPDRGEKPWSRAFFGR
jgi:hypothetical protein